MSYAVARMQKMKSGNLGGAYKHNERIFKEHSNKDIDSSRSHLNYELTERDHSISYEKQIKDYVDKTKISNRAIRKDAVLCDEWIITSDKQFFENLSDEQTREFFETAKNYFAEQYGEENIAYASVHLDEKTPHMHMGIVPMRNGTLSSKAMFNRDELKKIQADFPEYLSDNGFDLERGKVNSEAKHLSVKDYKEKQQMLDNMDAKIDLRQAKMQQLTKDLADKKEALSTVDKIYEDLNGLGLSNLQEGRLGKKTLGGKVKIEEGQLNRLVKTAVDNISKNHQLRANQERMTSRIKILETQVSNKGRLLNELNSTKEEVTKLKIENSNLKDKLNTLMERLNIATKRLSLWRTQAKNYMPTKDFKKIMKSINAIKPAPLVIKTVQIIKRVIDKSM
ncbi:TPA: MobV family relaxase [Streptococcus mutans]|uniref:MobV family relaxase n=1 Tax=Streptococcus mutans TaxID=1309 RepID=UPI001454E664|nr:MobV family relaxase [Streptococcus mutans]NLQ71406.1 plasmid recombination protein [Streptococcus mutans]